MVVMLCLVLLCILAWTIVLFRMQQASFWNFQIVAFEQVDRRNPPKSGAVLFIGSSSIRKWKTLEQDMAPLSSSTNGTNRLLPYPLLERGGEAEHRGRRLVTGLKPRC